MGVGRDFSRGGSRGFSQIFFQGGQNCWNFFFTPINWRNNLFLLIISKSRGAKAPLLPLPTAMPIYMWHEQAIIEWLRCSISAMLAGERLNKITSVREEWLRRLISIVTCCHSVKLCTLAARASDRNKTVLWRGCERSCQVQTLQKERAIGAVRCKNEGCCCNLSVGVALNVRFTTNGMCANRAGPSKCGTQFKTQARGPSKQWCYVIVRHHAQSTVEWPFQWACFSTILTLIGIDLYTKFLPCSWLIN